MSGFNWNMDPQTICCRGRKGFINDNDEIQFSSVRCCFFTQEENRRTWDRIYQNFKSRYDEMVIKRAVFFSAVPLYQYKERGRSVRERDVALLIQEAEDVNQYYQKVINHLKACQFYDFYSRSPLSGNNHCRRSGSRDSTPNTTPSSTPREMDQIYVVDSDPDIQKERLSAEKIRETLHLLKYNRSIEDEEDRVIEQIIDRLRHYENVATEEIKSLTISVLQEFGLNLHPPAGIRELYHFRHFSSLRGKANDLSPRTYHYLLNLLKG